jgi:hypothetical protein
MAALNAVQLPERLKDRDNSYQTARGLLSRCVGAMEPGVLSSDENAIKEAVESVHTNYQKLEKILE